MIVQPVTFVVLLLLILLFAGGIVLIRSAFRSKGGSESRACPHCQHVNMADARFCAHCGKAIS